MKVQVDIEFDQLIQLAKQLTPKQWIKLKTEVEKEQQSNEAASDMEAFLLDAPTFSTKQFNAIAKTRKAISQWRTK
ncbi:hypothetical protein DYU11_24650 [Fibrisoma montanum]|uniref:Antitoxin n=1 Tax=Fibrisoma montanum TaxID=2305895 RepID=A0A418M145_9BACT|nr:hypothetical protein [Fibrisoma montanum]RIV19300.1 hypothetical protein DYU11_24650 [Fibrisoma montanum]